MSLGEASVTELGEPFQMSMPSITKHLKVLEKAGFITLGRDAQWRPCRIHASPLEEVNSGLDQYRKFEKKAMIIWMNTSSNRSH